MGSQGFLCVHRAHIEMSCLETREIKLLFSNSDFAIANFGAKTLLTEAVSRKKLAFDAFDI